MQHVRTNNNVEGMHNNLKAVAGEYCKQSNIFTFIHFYIVLGTASIKLISFLIKMKTEADKIPMTVKLLSQKQTLIAKTKYTHWLLSSCWRSLGKSLKRFRRLTSEISGAEDGEKSN